MSVTSPRQSVSTKSGKSIEEKRTGKRAKGSEAFQVGSAIHPKKR